MCMKYVAVGIIKKDVRILACQRKRTARYPLKWEFPGGKLEPNETATEALVRELHEELCIEARAHEEFFQQEWVYAEGIAEPAKDGAFTVSYFIVHSFTGKLVNKAFEQILWVTPSQLLTMDILEGNRKAIELLVNYTKGRDEARE
jgi:8-oxo-dGTP diphosphatase